ncbi:sodium-type flagellar protein [Candidatus Photodesmus katoptron]|uniref:Sodium-type flagellar protein MotY n=1 Tax=Candidatus Photodesmus katoptron Akat1 TaxID=1236703 RepID=S3EHJ6_9GAMM|nr:OmpA family protein [Candidatus Photodesmus katoptron]EPE37658.1 sodium-type flagellar protein MotY [Candidatus Photodesmus katoptron Akat1]KEY90622.1 sodium-type flagellar protein [Candidatus Photodesmus katoptron]
MHKKIINTFMVNILVSFIANSSDRIYVATPEESTWEVIVNTPLECRLKHSIPNYAHAEFSSKADKKSNIHLELKMFKPIQKISNVHLVSIPPSWYPSNNSGKHIANIKFFKHFDAYLSGRIVSIILSELEKGYYPTFSYYQDWQKNYNERTEFALSSVSFQKTYSVFMNCITNLLPYNFEDISFVILHYIQDTLELNEESQKHLDKIAKYIRYYQDIKLISISSYTDAGDSKKESQHLTEQRATALKNYFQELGLSDSKIYVQAYGKRRPIANNSSLIGRNKNERIVLSLRR